MDDERIVRISKDIWWTRVTPYPMMLVNTYTYFHACDERKVKKKEKKEKK